MKGFPWLWAGIGGFFGLALAAGFLGLLQPGGWSLPTELAAASKSRQAEAKKLLEASRDREKHIDEQETVIREGTKENHRVFVSRTLVFLPEKKDEPVQALTRNSPIVTADGILVAWKLQNEFDPADPGVAEGDPDGDGFTNREEFEAQTNPRDKQNSPAKETKLRVRSGEAVTLSVTFPEKSGGILTIRFQTGAKRAEFKGKPGDLFWLMAGPGAVEVFFEEPKVKAAQARRKEASGLTHAIPIQMVSYQEKVEMVKDASTGVDVEMDNSTMVLRRGDALSQEESLLFGASQKGRLLTWDIGEIRLYSPVAGVGEIGPFQVGQVFAYENQDFAILKREGRKVLLRALGEVDKDKQFWVPGENVGAAPPLAPASK